MHGLRQSLGGHTRRRVLGVAAGLAGSVAAAACAVGQDAKSGQPRSAEPRSVEWLVWDKSEVWGRVAAQFNRETPGITATANQIVVGADEFAQKLQATVVGGTAPDMAMASPVQVRPLAEAKVYRTIEDLAKKERGWTDSYFPTALDTFRVQGKLYGVWHYANPQGVFYNKQLLATSGVSEPTDEWTYAQWLDAAKRITKRGEPATAVWGTDAPISFNYILNAVRSFGGALFDNDEEPKRFTGADAKAVEGIQFLADLLVTHRVAPTPADLQGQGDIFYGGRLGFRTAIAVVIGDIRRQMKQEWDVAPLPKGPAARSSFFGANGSGFTVPANRDPAAAWAFLKFLSGTAAQKEYLAEFGAVPTLKSLAAAEYLRQPAPPARLKVIADAMAYTKPLPKLNNSEVQRTIEAALREVFTGVKAPKAAMAEIEAPVNQLLRA